MPGLQAHQVHGRLHGDGVDLHEQGVDEVEIAQLRLQSLFMAAGQIVRDHVVHGARHDIRPHGDDAGRAEGHQRDGDVIVAAVHREVVAQVTRDLHGIADIAAGLLDGHDVRVDGEPPHNVRRNFAAGAAGDVIEDDRRGSRIRRHHEVAVHALFIRLDIIGADAQQRRRAHLGIDDALVLLHLTGVRACARDDGDAAVDVIDHAFQCFDILLQRGGRRLARGAERKDRVRTVGDVPVTQLPKAGKINAAVLMERSDQRDDGTG